MSKKLLSEAQVRRFQSLASIKPLNEMYNEEKEEIMEMDSEGVAKELESLRAKCKDGDESACDKVREYDRTGNPSSLMEVEEAEIAPEVDEPEMEEADVEMDEELVQKFMDAVGTMQQVADVLGGEVEDVADEEEPMDLDIDDAEEAPMELDAGDEAEEKEEDEMLEEALRGINYIPSKKEIVKTVAQRVAKRLNEAKQAEARLNKALGKK